MKKFLQIISVAVVTVLFSSVASAQWNTSGNDIYNTNTGKVGIGTSTPGTHLDVYNGTLRVSGGSGGEEVSRFVIDTGPSTAHSPLEFRNNDGIVMKVMGNGSVGIGTSVIQAKLHVNGTADGSLARFKQANGTNNPILDIISNESGNYIRLSQSGSNIGSLRFATNATDRMTIEPQGDIGIGTTAPQSKLHVVQASNTDWAAFIQNVGGAGKGLRVQAAAGTTDPVLQVEDNSGTSRFVVQSNGETGVNTTPLSGYALNVNQTLALSGAEPLIHAPNARLMLQAGPIHRALFDITNDVVRLYGGNAGGGVGEKGIKFYTERTTSMGYQTMHLQDRKVAVGKLTNSTLDTHPYTFSVRGGPAYFNAIADGGNANNKTWTTAAIVNMNSDYKPTDTNPNREMRFLQGGPFQTEYYGAGISFGLAPSPTTSGKWRPGAWSTQQFLFRYSGQSLMIQGGNETVEESPSTHEMNDNTTEDGSGNNSGNLYNLIKISHPSAFNGGVTLKVFGNTETTGSFISSDKRFKEDISTIRGASEKLLALRGTTYKYNREILGESAGDNLHYGFIAQEIREVLPELVNESADEYLSVNYDGVVPVLVEAFKELNEKFEAQNKKIAELEGRAAGTSEKSSTDFENNSIILEQNAPNPFSVSTTINYFLPETVNQATVMIYDMNGKQLKTFNLTQKGRGSITVNGNDLSAGMYLYALIADGKEVDVKRMILTN